MGNGGSNVINNKQQKELHQGAIMNVRSSDEKYNGEILRKDIGLPFQLREIQILYEYFSHYDKRNSGFLNVDEFVQSIEADKLSVLSLLITHLFIIIPKSSTNKICFIEWAKGISAYCLYSKELLMRFVFDMIDQDRDGRITKSEITDYLNYKNPNTGVKVFPANYRNAIQFYQFSKSYAIQFQEFRKVNQIFKFICWPAHKFQETLRDQILGEVFWEKMHAKIQRIETQQRNTNNKAQETKKKEISQKDLNLEERFKKGEFSMHQNNFKRKLFKRKPKEIGSDSKILQISQRKKKILSQVYFKKNMISII